MCGIERHKVYIKFHGIHSTGSRVGAGWNTDTHKLIVCYSYKPTFSNLKKWLQAKYTENMISDISLCATFKYTIHHVYIDTLLQSSATSGLVSCYLTFCQYSLFVNYVFLRIHFRALCFDWCGKHFQIYFR